MSDLQFKPDDFVYVDPDLRKAVGLVEWDKNGDALQKEWPYPERPPREGDEKSGRPPRKPKKRYYPWGSYKTMCKLYKLEGKVKDKEVDDYIPLEEAIGKLQEEPYWG